MRNRRACFLSALGASMLGRLASHFSNTITPHVFYLRCLAFFLVCLEVSHTTVDDRSLVSEENARTHKLEAINGATKKGTSITGESAAAG